MLSDIPRFNAARRYGVWLALLGFAFLTVAAALFLLASENLGFRGFAEPVIPTSLGYLGAAFLLPSAGFLSAALMSFARQRHLHLETNAGQSPKPRRTLPFQGKRQRDLRATLSSWASRISARMPDATTLAEWPQSLVTMSLAAVALVAVVAFWRASQAPALSASGMKLLAGALLVAAFPLLVLERILANVSVDLLPEAPFLDRLVRVPLSALLGVGLGMVLLSAGLAWATRVNIVVAIIIAAIASELLFRACATLFLPFPGIAEQTSLANSSIAGALLRLGTPNIRTFNLTIRRQLGIDLSRSWALAFVLKAALPIVAGTAFFAWAVTGLSSLGVSQRGVYERFGVPVAIFQPGLHIHLPWPLGVVRPIEVGVIHQLPIEFLLPNGAGQIVPEEPEEPVSAEGPAPASADRLWDDAHPFEGSYLIASGTNGQQGFQLVDVDMAVVYQVGTSDSAARDAAYQVTDTDQLIQALSGQILVRYLSQNTLLDLLGKSRESFSGEFQARLQKQLDGLSAGIDVLAISIEAIHPPPGAANSYHNVQAAEIRARTGISVGRGTAVRQNKLAELEAIEDKNRALAEGAELIGQAQAVSIVFGGDRRAYDRDRTAFLLEQWFGNLSTALEKASAVIIDHRLHGQDIPLVDLRSQDLGVTQSLPPPLPQTFPSRDAPPSPYSSNRQQTPAIEDDLE